MGWHTLRAERKKMSTIHLYSIKTIHKKMSEIRTLIENNNKKKQKPRKSDSGRTVLQEILKEVLQVKMK